MNLVAGIVVAAVGFIVAVLGAIKIVPGITQPGVFLLLLGGLIIGLSFVKRPEPEGVERMSTAATLANIFVSPTEVFQNLRRHPRWLVPLIVMTLLSATYTNLFMNRLGAERIANFAIDKAKEISFIPDEARAEMEKGRPQAIADAKNPVLRAGQAVSGFVGSVFVMAALAGIFALFALAMGGKINFWQAFSVAVYAMFPVRVIQFVLNTLILHLKDPVDIHPITGQQSLIQDNLGALFTPSEHPVLYTIGAFIGILSFYWVWLNATGLKNTGERVSGTTAWSATLAIFLFGLVLATASALIFPGFIS